MPGRQAVRSEETRQAILTAAGDLFAERGYDTVTMREIARAAGCSHTAIYIYFRDKETLLNQLAMEPLHALQEQMESALTNRVLSPDDQLRLAGRLFVRFCLSHRSMYNTMFMARGSRVDEAEPELEVQRLRNRMFGLLAGALSESLHLHAGDPRALACARVYFFMMHGIVATYVASPEPFDALMERLAPTFDLAVDALVAGLKDTVCGGANQL